MTFRGSINSPINQMLTAVMDAANTTPLKAGLPISTVNVSNSYNNISAGSYGLVDNVS